MIEKLAQSHDEWIRYAVNVCGNRDDANDLVQEMYLKLYDCDKEINKSYVYCVIKNLFLDQYRKNKVKEKTVYYQEEYTEQNEEIDFTAAYEDSLKELKSYKQLIVNFSTKDGVNNFARQSGISKATIIRIRNEFKTILCQKVKDWEIQSQN
jgi:DNA-directed RNA polymerase specialized sigma24 family protein